MMGCGGKPVCDFCSSEHPSWSYPAENFVATADETWASDGAWLACNVCHDMIERDQQEKLVRYAIACCGNRLGFSADELTKEERTLLFQQVRSLHKDFWSNRKGRAGRL